MPFGEQIRDRNFKSPDDVSLDTFAALAEKSISTAEEKAHSFSERLKFIKQSSVFYLGETKQALESVKNKMLGTIEQVGCVETEVRSVIDFVDTSEEKNVQLEQFAREIADKKRAVVNQLVGLLEQCEIQVRSYRRTIAVIDGKLLNFASPTYDDINSGKTLIFHSPPYDQQGDFDPMRTIFDHSPLAPNRTASPRQKEAGESERIVKKYWPHGVDTPIWQGKIGDCFMLAALDCLKHSPDGENLLTNVLDAQGNAHFFDTSVGRWENVPIPFDDINDEVYRKKGVRGSIGDRAIERSFLRFLHQKRGGIVGNTLITKPIMRGGQIRNQLLVDGGYIQEALYYLVGQDFQKFRASTVDQMKNMLNAVAQDRLSGNNDFMATAASKREIKQKSFFRRTKIIPKHAYRVKDVDIKSQTVKMVEPYDTRVDIEITIKEFLVSFSEMYVVKKAERRTSKNDHTMQWGESGSTR